MAEQPTETDALFTVTKLATDLGVTARTIRFYEDKGLITPSRAGSTRVYTHRDRARMKLILRGKRLGFTLREIKEFLELYVPGGSQVAQTRKLLKAVRHRLDELEEQRLALEQTLDELREIEATATTLLQEQPVRRRTRAAAAKSEKTL
jgi:DNA-binding transcriptional MerR regulator